jgi:hypothetical protein
LKLRYAFNREIVIGVNANLGAKRHSNEKPGEGRASKIVSEMRGRGLVWVHLGMSRRRA